MRGPGPLAPVGTTDEAIEALAGEELPDLPPRCS